MLSKKNKLLLLLWLLYIPTKVRALDLLQINELSWSVYNIDSKMDGFQSYGQKADPGPGEKWNTGTALQLNINLLKVEKFSTYWLNKFHAEQTTQQIRRVGWHWEGGIKLFDRVDLYHEHHSRHAVDSVGYGHFPLENYTGIRVYLIKR